MQLFAVSLLSECHVAGALLPEPMHELAIHIVQAEDRDEARERGAELGTDRQRAYYNADDEEVSWMFKRVLECQELFDLHPTVGMEVSPWLFTWDRLCLNTG